MATKTLTVELPGDLLAKFIATVTEKGGRWRSGRKEESTQEAIESAVYAALMLFLQSFDGDSELPEFRDYMHEKYPELDEDLVTMMADLIKRERESRLVTPQMAQEIGRREIEKKHPHFFEE